MKGALPVVLAVAGTALLATGGFVAYRLIKNRPPQATSGAVYTGNGVANGTGQTHNDVNDTIKTVGATAEAVTKLVGSLDKLFNG